MRRISIVAYRRSCGGANGDHDCLHEDRRHVYGHHIMGISSTTHQQVCHHIMSMSSSMPSSLQSVIMVPLPIQIGFRAAPFCMFSHLLSYKRMSSSILLTSMALHDPPNNTDTHEEHVAIPHSLV